MAGFLYFVPGREIPGRLSYAFDRQPGTREVLAGGVGGLSGCVLFDGSWHEQLHRVGYYPDEQHWVNTGDNVHVGWYPGDPPVPSDLVRAKKLPGVEVSLGDGRDWSIPFCGVLRDGVFQPELPSTYKREAGKWVPGDVLPQYAPLSAIAKDFADRFLSLGQTTGEFVVDVHDEVSRAVSVLSFNYRVSHDEVGILNLFNTSNLSDVYLALVGLKKKGPLSSN